jgi:hypothetical protein
LQARGREIILPGRAQEKRVSNPGPGRQAAVPERVAGGRLKTFHRFAVFCLGAGLLPALIGAPARAGDVHGRVLLSYQKKPGGVRVVQSLADSALAVPPVIVFLRGNGMVTTRRGGPKTNTLKLTARGPDPAVLVARLGDSLRIANDTRESRRWFLFQGGGTAVLNLEGGESVTRPLDRFGVVDLYSDSPGAGMASVLVVENPFEKEAVPGGRFLLDGVTPGEYQVCAWQAGRPIACVPAVVPLDGTVAVRITLR